MFNMPKDSLAAAGIEDPPDAFSPEEISTFTARAKGAMLFEDSLGVCRFTARTDLLRLAPAVNAATGWDMDVQEAMRVGLRAANRLRAFNVRHGIGSELDAPSPRYGSAPIDGPAVGVTIRPHWNEMVANYYRLLGWDENGVPGREILEDLGLREVADDLGLPA